MASTADEAVESLLEKTGAGKQVKVMIDGPYGGLHTELCQVQEVLVIAGGSGITFALGTIEEAVRTQGPSKVTVAWVCRDIGESLDRSVTDRSDHQFPHAGTQSPVQHGRSTEHYPHLRPVPHQASISTSTNGRPSSGYDDAALSPNSRTARA